jgi:hypothetical protein
MALHTASLGVSLRAGQGETLSVNQITIKVEILSLLGVFDR